MPVATTVQIHDAKLLPIPNSYQQLKNLSVAKGLTVPKGADYVVIIVEGEGIRWREDGVDPTATEGMPLEPNIPFLFNLYDLSALKFISQTPTDEGSGSGSGDEPPAKVNAMFLKQFSP